MIDLYKHYKFNSISISLFLIKYFKPLFKLRIRLNDFYDTRISNYDQLDLSGRDN